MNLKKIVIDARLSGLEHAGIGRYVQMLTEQLEKLRITDYGLRITEIKPDIKHYTLTEQIRMLVILAKEKPDLVHFPHFNVPLFCHQPFVVTIHDLLWHEQVGFETTTLSKWKYIFKYVGYRAVMRHAVKNARAIIVPSKWVKKQLVDRFPEVRPKTAIIYEGISEKFITRKPPPPSDEQLLEKFDLEPKKYLIYTGSLYPHKNLKVVLDVLSQFPQLKLVVACARSVFWKRFADGIKRRGLSDQVVLAGFVPDEELVALYQKALAFVFPSKSEGFGLPGLEAMAVGCPVVSSNAGSLPEIYGKSAAFFKPDDREGLIGAIREIRDDRGVRKRLIEKGKKRASQFSWQKCAEETLEVYARSLGL